MDSTRERSLRREVQRLREQLEHERKRCTCRFERSRDKAEGPEAHGEACTPTSSASSSPSTPTASTTSRRRRKKRCGTRLERNAAGDLTCPTHGEDIVIHARGPPPHLRTGGAMTPATCAAVRGASAPVGEECEAGEQCWPEDADGQAGEGQDDRGSYHRAEDVVRSICRFGPAPAPWDSQASVRDAFPVESLPVQGQLARVAHVDAELKAQSSSAAGEAPVRDGLAVSADAVGTALGTGIHGRGKARPMEVTVKGGAGRSCRCPEEHLLPWPAHARAGRGPLAVGRTGSAEGVAAGCAMVGGGGATVLLLLLLRRL